MESEVLPEGASGATEDMYVDTRDHPYENAGTMDKSLESAATTDKHNEEAVEAEVLIEGSSGNPEDLDVYSSVRPYLMINIMKNMFNLRYFLKDPVVILKICM